MVLTEAISLVEWLLTTLGEGGKYVLNYFPQHYKYYMPGAIMFLSIIFMFLTASLILLISSGAGEIGIGTNSVSKGTGTNDVGRIGQGTGAGSSGTVTQTTGSVTTTLPSICGNGICQRFQTSAKYAYEEALVGNQCTTAEILYDIPGYCRNGALLKRFIIYGASWLDPRTYQDAACLSSIYSYLDGRCTVYENSLWYTENAQNCPEDCSGEYDCYYDYTCNDNPSNCGNYAESECCSPGTVHEYECLSYGLCNDATLPVKPLSMLKRVPVHCTCTSDLDCVEDEGGKTCCTSGAYSGFCYPSYRCEE